MTRDAYRRLLAQVMSGDPDALREANRRLYRELVDGGAGRREADLVLAEVAASWADPREAALRG